MKKLNHLIRKEFVFFATSIILATLVSCSSGFSKSSVKNCVEANLAEWSGYDYTRIHIDNVEVVNETPETITYRWYATFKYQGIKCKQSGFIYFYPDGKVQDFRVYNDMEVLD